MEGGEENSEQGSKRTYIPEQALCTRKGTCRPVMMKCHVSRYWLTHFVQRFKTMTTTTTNSINNNRLTWIYIWWIISAIKWPEETKVLWHIYWGRGILKLSLKSLQLQLPNLSVLKVSNTPILWLLQLTYTTACFLSSCLRSVVAGWLVASKKIVLHLNPQTCECFIVWFKWSLQT